MPGPLLLVYFMAGIYSWTVWYYTCTHICYFWGGEQFIRILLLFPEKELLQKLAVLLGFEMLNSITMQELMLNFHSAT
jgi:hypothetical protein